MQNAVIYTRVSTEEQVSNFSLELQEESCRKHAKLHDLKLLRVFKEEGASGKTVNGRPELLKLIKYCQDKKNDVSTILVYRYDRWSRNTSEGLALISLLAQTGVHVLSITEPTKDDAFGKAVRGIMLVMAELDNNIKSERTVSGMKAAFKAGRWPWKAPIGYKHVIVGEKKRLALVPNFQPILSHLFTQAATGLYTKQELAISLNKLNFTKLWGTPATDKTIDQILHKKLYYGLMESKTWSEERWGKHTPVTDEETWLKAYDAIYNSNDPRVTTPTSLNFPLRGFVTCDSCLRPLTGSSSRGNGGRYSYYHCARKGCLSPAREAKEALEEAFIAHLNQFTLTPIQQSLLHSVLTDGAEKKVRLHHKAVRQLNTKLKQLREEKRTTLVSLGKGIVSDQEAKELFASIKVEETVVKLEVSENKIDKLANQAIVNFVTHFAGNVGKYWNELDINRKRKLQLAIFPQKIPYDGENFGTAKISRSFQLIKSLATTKKSLVTPRRVELRLLG